MKSGTVLRNRKEGRQKDVRLFREMSHKTVWGSGVILQGISLSYFVNFFSFLFFFEMLKRVSSAVSTL